MSQLAVTTRSGAGKQQRQQVVATRTDGSAHVASRAARHSFGQLRVQRQPPPPPACPAPRQSKKATSKIQPVVVADDDGKNPTTAAPLGSAQSIWAKCCLEWTTTGTVTVSKTSLKTLPIRPPVGGAATAEETALFTAAGVPDGIQIISVNQFSRGGVTGKNVAGGGKTYDAGTASPRIVVVTGVAPEVVAHEVGHATGHMTHDANATVMKPTGAHDAPNPTAVSAGVCRDARTGAVLTASTTSCCQVHT